MDALARGASCGVRPLERGIVQRPSRQESSHDGRVELRPGVVPQLLHGSLVGQAGAIGPIGGHGVEGIADEDDAGIERDADLADIV